MVRPITLPSTKTAARYGLLVLAVISFANAARAAAPVHACDRLVVLPYDRQRLVEKPPEVDPELPRVIEVCERAVNGFPEEARFHFFYAFAAHALALALREGNPRAPVEILFNGAVRHFEIAASKNYVVAQYALGSLYENGEGVAKDYSIAAKWYAAAALNGYAPAHTAVGRFYALGQGVKRNFVKAFEAYKFAAADGDPEGALEAAKIAAIAGNSHPEALVNAYMWAFVASSGFAEKPHRAPEAEEVRKLIQPKLSAAQIGKAEELAATMLDLIESKKAERSGRQPKPSR